MRDQSDTRSRIQRIALDLFIEQGYEATSLREIAERLGVTKAALYYHFKTKDDIIGSLLEDRLEDLQALIAWAEDQVGGPTVRRDFILRYADQLRKSGHQEVMRFLERNQTAMRDNQKSERMREYIFKIIDLLSSPDDPPTVRLRASLALFVLHVSWLVLPDRSLSDEERMDAAVQVALELLGEPSPEPARPAGGPAGSGAAA